MGLEEDVQTLVRAIVDKFHPELIVLFGSQAHGTARPDSDFDLLVVLPFEGTVYRQTVRMIDELKPSIPVHILPRRPDDFARRQSFGDPLIRDAMDRGRVLYRKAA